MAGYRLYCVNSNTQQEWDWFDSEYETQEEAEMDAELYQPQMEERHPDCYFAVRWVEEA